MYEKGFVSYKLVIGYIVIHMKSEDCSSVLLPLEACGGTACQIHYKEDTCTANCAAHNETPPNVLY